MEPEDHCAAKEPGGRYEYRDEKQRDPEELPGPATIGRAARLAQ
jgi:hypothetical protein